MCEALNLYLSEPDRSFVFSLTNPAFFGDSIVEAEAEPENTLTVLLHHYRKIHNLSQKEMTEHLGVKNIWSYQKLETPRTNPSLKSLSRLKKAFPDLELERLFP